MKNLKQKLTVAISTLASAMMVVAPFGVRAADLPPSNKVQGAWTVTTLGKNSADWKIESYKLDKGIVAWTELNTAGTKRRLYVFYGTGSQLLAEMPATEWSGDTSGFVEAVKGDYDVADGVVVWEMSDGRDREIYSWSGDAVTKVSDNTYDDRHPVAGEGRIAWTSTPNAGGAYNLMVKDANGTKRMASWMVTNYAFSGKTLYWLNKNPGEGWFRVFRNDGFYTVAIGKGDDRPLSKYFTTDDKGSAAWEYSTKRWDYDKREMFVSNNGEQALMILQRDVPPNVTRIEDMDGGRVLVTVHDLLNSRLIANHTLSLYNGRIVTNIWQKSDYGKAKFFDGGYVTPREPGSNIGLTVRYDKGGTDFVSLDPVVLDRFDADGGTVAGARVGGGTILWANGKWEVIASGVENSELTVKNGDVAWIEGSGDTRTLKVGVPNVLVRAPYGAARVAGRLVKAAGSPEVYLAANDGNAYLFSDETIFRGWYKDFTSVQVVSKATLAALPKGGKVLLNPTKQIVKSKGSPSVYAVGTDGQLHWVSSEESLRLALGADWAKQVVTVSDVTMSDYSVGAPVNSANDFFLVVSKKI